MDLVFLDTETTGFGECRLIELAYAHTVPLAGTFDVPEIRSFRVKPPIPIEEQASAVHGIYPEMLALEPSFQEHPEYADLQKILGESLVVMHSAPFDVGVLEREGISVPYWLDTKRAARVIYPKLERHKLQSLRKDLGLEVEGEAHTAGGDVAVMIALFRHMQKELRRIWGESPEEALQRLAILGGP